MSLNNNNNNFTSTGATGTHSNNPLPGGHHSGQVDKSETAKNMADPRTGSNVVHEGDYTRDHGVGGGLGGHGTHTGSNANPLSSGNHHTSNNPLSGNNHSSNNPLTGNNHTSNNPLIGNNHHSSNANPLSGNNHTSNNPLSGNNHTSNNPLTGNNHHSSNANANPLTGNNHHSGQIDKSETAKNAADPRVHGNNTVREGDVNRDHGLGGHGTHTTGHTGGLSGTGVTGTGHGVTGHGVTDTGIKSGGGIVGHGVHSGGRSGVCNDADLGAFAKHANRDHGALDVGASLHTPTGTNPTGPHSGIVPGPNHGHGTGPTGTGHSTTGNHTVPGTGHSTTGAHTGTTGTHTGTTGTHTGTTGTHTGTGAHTDSTGHASMVDKIIGGAQATVGKMANNPTMVEKGAVRKTEGKAAVDERHL